ncbi:transcription termination factor NusA [bacterium]|nr:transcription termination factor NusA [bacterium]
MNSEGIVESAAQIAKTKGISRQAVAEILQQVFLDLVYKKYGNEVDNFEVIVNLNSGQIEIYQEMEVVETVEQVASEISLSEAQQFEDDVEIGDPYIRVIEQDDLGNHFDRRLISLAKQNLSQQLQQIEKNKIFDEYSTRINEIITGEVHQNRQETLYVVLDKIEMRMPKEEQIPGEKYRRGKNLRAVIKEVVQTQKGPEVIISRSSESFLRRMLEIEVPEVFDGIVEVHGIARDPGKRAKIVVESFDKRVDAVGACVGVNGVRIQSIVRELNNEKIDIINYSKEPAVLIARALSPARPLELEIDEQQKRVTALFAADDIAVAIGESGQNINLASKVCGYEIDAIKDESIESLSLLEIDVFSRFAEALSKINIHTIQDFTNADSETLLDVPGIGEKTLEKLTTAIEELL